MPPLTIQNVQASLKKIQDSANLIGDVSSIATMNISDALCKKFGIPIGTQGLFARVGKDRERQEDGDPDYCLFFIENEGAIIFPLRERTNFEVLIEENTGLIGYGKKENVEADIKIIWEQNRPKAKMIKTGQIIELSDLPNEPLHEEIVVFNPKTPKFSISGCLFGNAHLFLVCAAGEEWCLMYIDEKGKNHYCVEEFRIQGETMAEVRAMIKELGHEAEIKALQTIILEHQ